MNLSIPNDPTTPGARADSGISRDMDWKNFSLSSPFVRLSFSTRMSRTDGSQPLEICYGRQRKAGCAI